MNAPCPTAQVVAEFIQGRLSEVDLDSVADHIELCQSCQAVVETLERASGTMLSDLRQLRAAAASPLPSACAAALARAELFFDLPEVNSATEESDSRLGWLRNYELLEKVGQGGMGAVYKARHAKLNRLVALKVLAKNRVEDAQSVARFEAEMKAVGSLEHPHIVRAFDADEVNGVHFLVMEHVAGCDLARLLKALGHPVNVPEACEAVRQAALGLQHAWQNGLVHRDIKPSNLILTPQGVVKVLDLGLAVLQPGMRTGEELTEAAQVLGTVDYIAPEQIRDSHAVDCRADIYSLGCTLFKLLTGRAPFADGSRKQAMQVIAAHLAEPAPNLRTLRPEVPAELAAVVACMLAKQLADRFATPAAVAEALAPFARGAQLAALLARVNETGAVPQVSPEVSSTTTFAHLSSSFTDTHSSSPQVAPEEAPQIQTAAAGNGGWARHWKTALAGFGGAAALLAIILFVRGNKIEVPEGSEVKIAADGTVSVTPPHTALPPVTHPAASAMPTGAADDQPTTPLSRLALVGSPAPLPGVTSWSLETVGHRGEVRAVAYSPNGQFTASAGDDGVVRIWEAATGKLVRMLLGHIHPVMGLAFSADSEYLASGGPSNHADGIVIEWQVATGRREHEMATSGAAPSSLERGPQPHQYWLGFNAARVNLVDVARQTIEKNLETGVEASLVRVSPNGELLAISPQVGKQAKILEVASGQTLATFTAKVDAHIGPRITWAPDSTRVAVTDALGEIEIWDVRQNKQLKSFRAREKTPQPLDIFWAGSETVLLFGHFREVWNVAAGEKLRDLGPVGHRLAIGPDGRSAFYDASHGNIGWMNLNTGEEVRLVTGSRVAVGLAGKDGNAWRGDGKVFGMGAQKNDSNWLYLIEAASGKVLASLASNHDEQFAGFEPGTNHPIVARWREGVGTLTFYDENLKQPLRTIDLGKIARFNMPVYSPDGRWFALGDFEGNVRVFNASGNKPAYTFAGHKGEVHLAWSPDSRELATVGHDDYQLRVQNLATGQPARTIPEPRLPWTVAAVRWSPDGQTIAAIPAHTSEVQMLDAKSGEKISTLKNSTGGEEAYWTDNSERFAFFTYGRTVRWVNAATGELEREVPGFAGYYASLAPNGRTLACVEGAIRLWDIETGRRHGTQVWFSNGQAATLGSSGHLSVTHSHAASEFRYIVQTEKGQATLTAAEFSARFGWKNEPGQAELVPVPVTAATVGAPGSRE